MAAAEVDSEGEQPWEPKLAPAARRRAAAPGAPAAEVGDQGDVDERAQRPQQLAQKQHPRRPVCGGKAVHPLRRNLRGSRGGVAARPRGGDECAAAVRARARA
eukprot:CAMPEP_0180055932 /NCGR_PEP_ID=MMETSP0985-20121206/3613_1 /TAXON_ID=483367 /ORGANISM="non described non described, Strain CCMP 2436" /LENGTH=102 /DNA_ID=CAMNT_0021985603 /DNA_START=527 /DNA_END=830 /DNA_ORIENTATION=-